MDGPNKRVQGLEEQIINESIGKGYQGRLLATLVASQIMDNYHFWAAERSKESKSLDDDLALVNLCITISAQVLAYGMKYAVAKKAGTAYAKKLALESTAMWQKRIEEAFAIMNKSDSISDIDSAFEYIEGQIFKNLEKINKK